MIREQIFNEGGLAPAFRRSFLRISGKSVSVDHYKSLWAETTQDGSGTITSFDRNRADTPDFRFLAKRVGESDNWNVVRQERVYSEAIENMNASRSQDEIYTPPFIYEDVTGSQQVLDTQAMLALLRKADTTTRAVGHISGVTDSPRFARGEADWTNQPH